VVAEAGDGVDYEQSLGLGVFEELGDRGHAVADAGRGLGGLHEYGAGLEVEICLDVIDREGLAVGHGDYIDVAAEGLGECSPALAELAGGENQHAIAGRGEVGDGCFHGAGSGAGEDDDVAGFSADELLELDEDAAVEGAELGSAVVNVSGCHGKLGGGEQWGRTGREEASLADHVIHVAILMVGSG